MDGNEAEEKGLLDCFPLSIQVPLICERRTAAVLSQAALDQAIETEVELVRLTFSAASLHATEENRTKD